MIDSFFFRENRFATVIGIAQSVPDRTESGIYAQILPILWHFIAQWPPKPSAMWSLSDRAGR
jgi:hypothetical protein